MTAPTQPAPIKIALCSVQFTPDREPVFMQYQGVGITSGPFATTQAHHTTQKALSERSGTPGQWGDADVKAELAAHLAEHGINAVIVDNVDSAPKEASPD